MINLLKGKYGADAIGKIVITNKICADCGFGALADNSFYITT